MYQQCIGGAYATMFFVAAYYLAGSGKQQTAFIKIIIVLPVLYPATKPRLVRNFIKIKYMRLRNIVFNNLCTFCTKQAYQWVLWLGQTKSPGRF